MRVQDLCERIEAGGLDGGVGLAEVTSARAPGVAPAIEGHRVAEEAAVQEDARAWCRDTRIEAQLDGGVDEFGSDLEEFAGEAHGPVLAHGALRAVQADLVEVEARGRGPQLCRLGEPVLAWHPTGGAVPPGVVLGTEPGPVEGVEVGERQGMVRQLVADLVRQVRCQRSIAPFASQSLGAVCTRCTPSSPQITRSDRAT